MATVFLKARDSQQVAVNVLFSDKPFHRQITALGRFFICKRLVHIRQSQMTSLLSSIAFSLIRRSRLHSQVSAPYLTASGHALSTINDVVNDLAVGIEEARLQFVPDRETIIVRCHALSTG
ncbi:hypothetical protein CNMCM8980_006643 [Aspergillus fumigatiaffinis]|uniref:Uncharacterized protein n=1 Tax=Aspergillus fumigatiaffinis TaxID=340414 RepID=A0A8H4H6X3_9EURO|nr:hypothetical protein CNMCM5878_007104 [Aspergillus fumigatiaffinis]KAF4227860.1 hypothetical protein CNMCM6457_007259 [Aspergillus fumigatiaffinis]KAF4236421.1 hypothetical protein CNMCM6805_007527 [Aspergillus fumigatiaffinis]KAF4247874.1 hypothetical protein CNMCM8980_006643 [Aspergillus fumigatiaffinis]